MLNNAMSLMKYLPLSFAVGLLALNAHAAETGHEHHQHKEIAPIADDPHAHHREMMKKPADSAKTTEVDLHDLVLMDQNGTEMKFVSEVIGNRIVVMDFVYTTCTTVCPVISAIFSQVQDKLGDKLGDEVALISVSVDPVRDTPQRLKAYAANHKAQPGWIWLTGNKSRMDKVLDGLGAYTTNFENHPAMVLVGDGRTGQWTRFFGFPNPDRIMKQVNALQAARKTAIGG